MADDELKGDSTQVMNEVSAPDIPYLPGSPKAYNPPIGLIGCGSVAAYHLEAYRDAGFHVAALCDIDESKAQECRQTFFPAAAIFTDFVGLLRQDDVEVVDIATHVDVRGRIIEDALLAGKHVLSQKPFVTDLDEGVRLADLADDRGLKLAVNQNGRWAPHLSYIRNAVAQGIIGDVTAAHLAVHWDHGWTAGSVFDEMRHLVLFDFGIHWFDILTCIMGGREAKRVFASVARAPGQKNRAPMLGQVAIEYEGAQGTVAFDAVTPFGALDETYVAGGSGTLASAGPDLSHQTVTLYRKDGYHRPALEGEWFKNGFHGTMAELLCAIEEDREPSNGAQDNLRSLALCFAALASADSGQPKVPGDVRRLPGD